MSMPTYAVCCLSRDRGTTYVIAVQARSIDDARQAAASAGHITGAIHEMPATPEPPAADAQIAQRLTAVGAAVSAMAGELSTVRSSPLIRAPIGTIGAALLVVLLAWTILLGLAAHVYARYYLLPDLAARSQQRRP